MGLEQQAVDVSTWFDNMEIHPQECDIEFGPLIKGYQRYTQSFFHAVKVMFVTILFDKSFLGSPFSDQVGVDLKRFRKKHDSDGAFLDRLFVRTNDMALPPEKQAIEQGE